MSRTKLGIIITLVTIISTLILGIFSFIRVKVIILNYGSELNGLMQVAVQLSAYLILIESGMTSAYQYSMYDKINNKNLKDISRLYSGLIINMRKIGVRMILISSFFPFFYAIFINKVEISYLDAVLVLLVMGIRLSLPYLLVIPQWGILAAFERQYVVDIIQLFVNVIVFTFEVVVIYLFQPPLYQVLMINIFFLLSSVPIYNKLVIRLTGVKVSKEVVPDMTPKNMTSDILVHQISGVVFNNIDNILLSISKNLVSVTVYSAYNTIINYPNQIINKIIGGLRSSLALKIQRKDDNAFHVYNEILSMESFFASIVVPMFFLMSNKFVLLWIGEEYTLKNVDILLFSLIILNRMITPAVLAARDAKGLYKESKMYTVLQAVSNIILSLLLIKHFGITGVLFGTVLSFYFIAMPFNNHLVDTKVFNKKSNIYLHYTKVVLISIIVVCIGKLSFGLIPFNLKDNWKSFFIEGGYLFLVSLLISFISYILSDKYFRRLINRFYKLKIR